MKAALIREHGGPEKVRVEEYPDPRPGPGEALIEVRAASLNHLDIWVMRGSRPGGPSLPHVMGCDASGVVVALGAGAESHAKVGQEVLINPGLYCGRCEYCRRGEHSECASFSILGASRQGTFARKVSVPVECLFLKPEHLSFEEAGCLGVAYVTAWRMLVERGRVRPGETVLIHGVGGGVGTAALQLARLLGAEVVVTSSSNDKLERARALGAAYTINYRERSDVAAAVREALGGRGVDLSINSVGAPALAVDQAALRRGGRAVICGVTAGTEGTVNLQGFYWNQLSLLGSTLGSAEDTRGLLRAMAAAKMRPVIDTVMPLADARKAFERMEQGGQFGKIVLNTAG